MKISKQQTHLDEGKVLPAEIYSAPKPPAKGRIIGLDATRTLTGAVFQGMTRHDTRKVTCRKNQTCERPELLPVHEKAVTDHTAITNALKGYLNQFAVRLGSRSLKLPRSKKWVIEATRLVANPT